MKTSPALAIFLSLAGAGLSNPLPAAAPGPEAEGSAAVVPALLPRASNSASCTGTITYPDATLQWIDWYIPADGPWVRNDWAQGFLDKLRNQCGAIISWYYQNEEWGWAARFTTSIIIPAGCIENAIWLASEPTGGIHGVKCATRDEGDGANVKFPKLPKPV